MAATHASSQLASRVERVPVDYQGIARSSLERSDFTPYEFETDGGVPVRLHDMQLVGFDYQVQPPALTMRFVYDDPEWTPTEALATPVVVFRFSDVHVRQWEDDDLAQTPADERGRVYDLGYDAPDNAFSLLTRTTRLFFSASRLEVVLEPAAHG
jgi:hypothetical protein